MIKVWMLILITSSYSGEVGHISQFETKEECVQMKTELVKSEIVGSWLSSRMYCIYGSSPFYYKIGEK
jgi:hypothetical protein